MGQAEVLTLLQKQLLEWSAECSRQNDLDQANLFRDEADYLKQYLERNEV